MSKFLSIMVALTDYNLRNAEGVLLPNPGFLIFISHTENTPSPFDQIRKIPPRLSVSAFGFGFGFGFRFRFRLRTAPSLGQAVVCFFEPATNLGGGSIVLHFLPLRDRQSPVRAWCPFLTPPDRTLPQDSSLGKVGKATFQR